MSMRIEQKHYNAFNFWFSCTQEGDSTTRALERTAEEFGVHERTARKWYDDMGWKKMGQKRMMQIQRELEKRDNRTFAQNQKKYLDILHRLLYDYVEDGLPAKIETVKDLEIVIKNSLLLQNQSVDSGGRVESISSSGGDVEVESEPLFNRALMEQILEQEEENEREEE